jgi:hypothetical protein
MRAPDAGCRLNVAAKLNAFNARMDGCCRGATRQPSLRRSDPLAQQPAEPSTFRQGRAC